MLGLCVGASLMTLFEVFDLIINLVYILFDRKLKVNKVKDVLADDKCKDDERIVFLAKKIEKLELERIVFLETQLKLSMTIIETLQRDFSYLKNPTTRMSSVDN